MILQHLGYTFDWNLPWANYKAGFGSINDNFWLGLENMYLLTSSQPYHLRLEMQNQRKNIWYSAEYWFFEIGDELNDKYRLHVAGFSGDIRDFAYCSDGMEFSTYDMDNNRIA